MIKNIAANTPFRFLTVFLCLILIASLSACTKEAETEDVSKLATALFIAIQNKDYDKVMTFYSKEFLSLTPASTWIKHLKEIDNKLGDLQTIKLKTQTASTIFSGRRFIFVYTNRYKKGPAKETVIFFQKINDTEIKVHSHKIESSLLPRTRH